MKAELRLTVEGLASFTMSPHDLVDEAADDRRAEQTAPARPEVRAVLASPSVRAEGISRFEVTVEGWRFFLTAEPEARARLRERATLSRTGRLEHGPVVVRAPMPGRVTRSWVAVGDTVEAGQRLLAIEAMKMENEVRSPRAGVVASVAVAAGSSVDLGDELVTVR